MYDHILEDLTILDKVILAAYCASVTFIIISAIQVIWILIKGWIKKKPTKPL